MGIVLGAEFCSVTVEAIGNSVRSIQLRPGCPGDLPSVGLRVGDVPRVTAPLALNRTRDRPSPGRQSRPERLVDSLNALDIDSKRDPVPHLPRDRFPRSRFLAELPKGIQGKEHGSGLIGSEVVARSGPLLPAQLGIKGPEGRHISYPKGDVADSLREGHNRQLCPINPTPGMCEPIPGGPQGAPLLRAGAPLAASILIGNGSR
jgi:hypothetical protein